MLANRIAVKVAFFINGFLYANWGSRLPRIQELYGIDDGTTGLVLLASSIGAVGAMPFTGWIILKNGSRRVTFIAVLGYCLVVPLIPVMPSLVTLIILYLLMGIATGMLDVAMNAQAILVEQKYQKPIMTSFHALFSIGMALGAWCGAWFADLSLDLIIHFLIVTSIAVLASLWLANHLIHDLPNPEQKHEGPLFQLPNASLIGIGIIAFCCMLGEGAMSDWSVNYMENITHSSKTLAPIGLSAFATAMTLGRIFGDRVRVSLGDKKMIVSGGIISCFGMGVALLFINSYAVIAGFFLVGLGLSTVVPIAYSIAGNAKDLPAGVGLAMVTTVGYSGFLFGPPLIGFLADWQNLRIALAVVAVLFFIMTILGVRYHPKS